MQLKFSRENLMQYYIASNPTWVGQEQKKINISSKQVIFHFHLYDLKKSAYQEMIYHVSGE